jgi:hypothetical protein
MELTFGVNRRWRRSSAVGARERVDDLRVVDALKIDGDPEVGVSELALDDVQLAISTACA